MANSSSSATLEAPKSTPVASPPAQDLQRTTEPEVDQSLLMGQRVMRAIGGGSPETPPDRFSTAMEQMQGSTIQSTGMLQQLQRNYGNRYVGQVIQRKCEECEKKEIQRKGQGTLPAVPEGFEVEMQRSGAGNPLDVGTRSFMESRFGQDFSDVQVHTDTAAAEAAKLINAQAFTTGRDIYFGAGRSQLQTQEGQKLLAHELTHVVQQRSGATAREMAKPVFGSSADVLEQEAEAVANQVVAGQSISPEQISVTGATSVQRYSLGEFIEDVEGAASTVSEAAVSVGESVYEGAVATGEAIASATQNVYEGAVAAGEAVIEAGEEAVSWVLTTAGNAALSAARGLVSLLGGSISITPAGLVITIPTITLIPSLQRTLAELPPEGFFIPFLEGGAMVGPIPVAGAFGFLGYAQPSIEGVVGPAEIRGIRITLNPFTSRYAATGQLYIAAAIAPRLTLFAGLAGVAGTIIPFEPPIPIVVIVQGGLRGTGTGWVIGALQSIVNLEYLAGTLSFDATNNLMLGTLLQGDVDLFAALRLYDKIICQYVYPLGHWETGRAWRLTIPVSASLSRGGGGSAGIGPITSGPMPISDIEIAIHSLPSGLNCMSWEEIKQFLCENSYLPPEFCEEEEGEPGVGIAGNCVANDNLTEVADNFISRCRKASIRSEFPGELLSETLGNIKKGKTARHKKAWKLLNDNRFKKPGASLGGGGGGSITAPCAVPVNYRQTVGRDNGGGILYFEYAWDSSTGNLADLSSCEVGEEVTYPGSDPFVWPKPPWDGSTPNPTIIWLPGSDGALGDTHSTKPFVKPYKEASFTATQYYRYRTSCANSGNPVNLMGPISIARSVKKKQDGKFKYTITKSRKSASIDPLP